MSAGRKARRRAASNRTNPEVLNDVFLEGVRLHQAGRLAEAAAQYQAVIEANPREAAALHMLGLVAYQCGDNVRAADLIGRAIRFNGKDATYHNNRGTVLMALNRFDEAAKSFRRALAINPMYAMAHNNLGNALQHLGQAEASIPCYRQALTIKADFAEAHYNLGRAEQTLRDLPAAMADYRAALANDPNHLKALVSLAGAEADMGSLDDARRHYDAAVRLAPNDAEILIARADLRERISDLEGALTDADAAHRIDAKSVKAAVLAARCERRLGRIDAARSRLEAQDLATASAELRAVYEHDLAVIFDQLGRYSQAFRHFTEGNRQILLTPAGQSIDRTEFPAALERLCERFTADWVSTWTPIAPAEQAPVFLVGFPRSGTTLLNQILDTHPSITTIEEKLFVESVRFALMGRPKGFPDVLATVTQDDVEQLRAIYESEVDRHLPNRSNDLFVDKMPLNLVDLGLIERLYPGAPILFLLRHPCDSVLSGFMQAFELNESMIQFASLESAARLYALVMRLWFRYEDVLRLNVLKVRYEDIIADFETEIRRVLDFLAMPWDDSLREYHEHAKKRRIAAPSYHQVTQPIYRRSTGRWLNYRAELEPILPVLAPFAEAFGYSLDAEAPPISEASR